MPSEVIIVIEDKIIILFSSHRYVFQMPTKLLGHKYIVSCLHLTGCRLGALREKQMLSYKGHQEPKNLGTFAILFLKYILLIMLLQSS